MESMFPEMTEIVDFKGYYISKDGRVFSSKRNGINEMVLKEDKDGYLEVGLYRDSKRYYRRVHRLVAINFISNPNNYPVINHKNGIKHDNRVENLEWVTISQNTIHGFRVLNREPILTTNKQVVLVDLNTQKTLEFNSIKECSEYIGIHYVNLGRILNKKVDIKASHKLKGYDVYFL